MIVDETKVTFDFKALPPTPTLPHKGRGGKNARNPLASGSLPPCRGGLGWGVVWHLEKRWPHP
jgi:hypothetical protein